MNRSRIPGTEAIRHAKGARAGLERTMTLPRLLVAVIGVVLLFLSVVLALAGVPHISRPGDVFSNLGRNLITTLAVALLAYVWFSLGTSYSATHRVRSEARRRPEGLFAVPPRVGRPDNVFGRERLVDQVATNLKRAFRTGPQVIIGETGSGKTSLLLALAAHFAEQGVHPIVLSLRDEERIDFSALAKDKFGEYVDPYVRAADDADKLWRSACRRGEIVVLADDLDRARVQGMEADPYKTAVRVALDAAGRGGLPLVVTSRPEALPPDLNVNVVDIGPLELEPVAATREVLTRAGRRENDPERNRIREDIEEGNLTAHPFYLGILADVLRLPSPLDRDGSDERNGERGRRSEHAVRVALLERWRASLRDKKIVPKSERRRRKRILDQVADFAVARITPDLDGPTDDPAAAEQKWREALHEAERFDVVEIDHRGRHRFKHDVLHAFFASGKRNRLLKALKRAPDAPRVQLSAVFAAAASRGKNAGSNQFCRDACERLIEPLREADERRLLRATAAAEIARAGGFHELDERIAATCADALRGAPPLIRRGALDQVAKLHGDGVVLALWRFAGDDDYEVRWAAAQELVDRCSKGDGEVSPIGEHAYKVLVSPFEESLEAADRLEKPADDRSEEILALKHMAWILPALRARAEHWDDPDLKDRSPEDLLERLLKLQRTKFKGEGVSSELGLEASIAQGFKVDALALITARELDREVSAEKENQLLADARFWYSQLNLLHAITLRVAYCIAQARGARDDGRKDVAILGPGISVDELLQKWKDQQPEERHPYVRAVAALCDRAIDEVRREVKNLRGEKALNAARRTVGRYVWGDEGVLVSQQPAELDKGEVAEVRRASADDGAATDRSSGLVDEAIQLVGDIVVLLNMNEMGNAKDRKKFALDPSLPYCMGQSHDRGELFDRCIGHPRLEWFDESAFGRKLAKRIPESLQEFGAKECDFGLCPYQPAINLPSAHREISRGFCRHQRHHATRRAAWRARRWGSKVTPHGLREFWEELEARARM